MRIAFTGSHCTGKTTLTNACKKMDPKVTCITEVARKIIRSGYPLNQDATVDSYIHYVNEMLKAEYETKNDDIVISDRTILDAVAYAKVNRGNLVTIVPDYLIEMMERVWLLEKNQYDLFVYFPVEFALYPDGIRPTDEKYRIEVGNMIRQLLDSNKVKYITVTGTTEKRLQILKYTINNIG